MQNLAQRIISVQERIAKAAARSGRESRDITLVAVSKTVDEGAVKAAYDLGLRDFGENRVPDLNRKREFLPQANWHMIGRLQTNKVKDVIGKAVLIHSLDRWNLAEEINKRAGALKIEVPTLLEINIAGEEQKAGLPPDDVEVFLRDIGQLNWVKVHGFMTMAPVSDNPEEVRPVFAELNALFKKYREHTYPNVALKFLSMGMSQDFEVAIEEGLPISFGILTVETVEQAIERAGTKAGNKGYEAALAIVETINLLKQAKLG